MFDDEIEEELLDPEVPQKEKILKVFYAVEMEKMEIKTIAMSTENTRRFYAEVNAAKSDDQEKSYNQYDTVIIGTDMEVDELLYHWVRQAIVNTMSDKIMLITGSTDILHPILYRQDDLQEFIHPTVLTISTMFACANLQIDDMWKYANMTNTSKYSCKTLCELYKKCFYRLATQHYPWLL